ncbi:MAG: hypothetical protein V4704_08435 [Pseudomonadota bacterium]
MPLQRTCLTLVLAGCALLAGMPAHAQEAGAEVVIMQENVRFDYAQVLAVDPVYQVLRTTRTERVCDGQEQAIKNGLSRVVGAVKGTLGAKVEDSGETENCRNVPVTRDYRRPIAYDVDYVYKGSKYRTRMARDPGNRLRIRVSVTPQPVAGP